MITESLSMIFTLIDGYALLGMSCATLVFPKTKPNQTKQTVEVNCRITISGEPKGEPWHQSQSVQRSCSRFVVPGGVLWNSGLVGSEGKKIGNGWYLGYMYPCDIPT